MLKPRELLTPVINANVLIVEDDADTADIYVIVLARAGFGVRKAINRDEALKVLRRNLYQIIIMDVMMPGASLDDFMVCRSTVFPMSKLILVSAYPGIEQTATRYNIKFWLQKPFDNNALESVVRQTLAERP